MMSNFLDPTRAELPGPQRRQSPFSTTPAVPAALTGFGTGWLLLVVLSTAGLALLYLPVAALGHRLAATYGATWLRRHAIRIGPDQLPHLYQRYRRNGAALGLAGLPPCHVLTGDTPGRLLQLLRPYHVVLAAGTVDALCDHEDALDFYIGHELGHLAGQREARSLLGLACAVTPLLGCALARERQYAADAAGAQCCAGTPSALRALTWVADGSRLCRGLNAEACAAQASAPGGLLASLMDLSTDRPSLAARIARLRRTGNGGQARAHPLAVALAAGLPRTRGGLAGAALLYALVLLCAQLTVLPAWVHLSGREADARLAARLDLAYATGSAAAAQVRHYVLTRERMPLSVQEAGFELPPDAGVHAILVSQAGGGLQVKLDEPHGGLSLYLLPAMVDGEFAWRCAPGPGIAPALLPPACRDGDMRQI